MAAWGIFVKANVGNYSPHLYTKGNSASKIGGDLADVVGKAAKTPDTLACRRTIFEGKFPGEAWALIAGDGASPRGRKALCVRATV